MSETDLLTYCERIYSKCKDIKDAHYNATKYFREATLESIKEKQAVMIREIFQVQGKPVIIDGLDLGQLLDKYAADCLWNYIDVVSLFSCLPDDQDRDRIVDDVVRTGLIYLSFRLVDDLIDDHLSYKKNYNTFYASTIRSVQPAGKVAALTVLPALLLALKGLEDNGGPVLNYSYKTVYGALLELSGSRGNEEEKDLSQLEESYYRLVDCKMVAYGMCLYHPVLNRFRGDAGALLSSFLRKSFLISQIANDYYDIEEDEINGQPNFWNIFSGSDEGARRYLGLFEDLVLTAAAVNSHASPYVFSRVADLANYFLQRASVSRMA